MESKKNLLTWICLIPLLIFSVACKEEKSLLDGIGKTHQDALLQPADKKTTIVADYGIPDFHLGMNFKEMVEKHGPSNHDDSDSDFEFEYASYQQKGIQLTGKKNRITCVHFYYAPDIDKDGFKPTKPFPGKTDKGIGSRSTPRDVILAYGEPFWVSQLEVFENHDYVHWTGQYDRSFHYVKLGISFNFIDEKLHKIDIYVPIPDPNKRVFCDTEGAENVREFIKEVLREKKE